MKNPTRKSQETICWNCKKSSGKCSWSADFTPVDGWDAAPTIIGEDYAPVDSFLVKSCPQFEKNARKGDKQNDDLL